MASYLDMQRLSALVRSKRGNRGLREMATIIGVSPATVSRVERGTVPDVATFLAICDWIEMPPAGLIKNMNGTQKLDTCHSVCAKLRTDKRLDPEVADAIALLIEFVYNQKK
jgi:transcriptional regulator with XRE-family HTH domain